MAATGARRDEGGEERGGTHIGTPEVSGENNARLRGSWLGRPRRVHADRFAKDPQTRRDARPISAAWPAAVRVTQAEAA